MGSGHGTTSRSLQRHGDDARIRTRHHERSSTTEKPVEEIVERENFKTCYQNSPSNFFSIVSFQSREFFFFFFFVCIFIRFWNSKGVCRSDRKVKQKGRAVNYVLYNSTGGWGEDRAKPRHMCALFVYDLLPRPMTPCLSNSSSPLSPSSFPSSSLFHLPLSSLPSAAAPPRYLSRSPHGIVHLKLYLRLF